MDREAESGDVTLDLSEVSWIPCIYSAPLATAVQRLRNQGVTVDIVSPLDNGVSTYLSTIGFPEGMKEPQSQWKDTYLPLIRLNTPGEESAIDAAGNTLRDLISKLVNSSGDVRVDGIYLPIGELLDNVDQHSRCQHGMATVQYYPKKQRLDLCIVDDGITIPGNFEQYGHEFDTDGEAVRQALTEGLSTKAEMDAQGRRRGTGLRTTAKVICDGLDGELLLSSRQATIHRDTTIDTVQNCSWDGTVIFGSLNVPKDDFNPYRYVAT